MEKFPTIFCNNRRRRRHTLISLAILCLSGERDETSASEASYSGSRTTYFKGELPFRRGPDFTFILFNNSHFLYQLDLPIFMEGQIFGCREAESIHTSHPSTQLSEESAHSFSSKRSGTRSEQSTGKQSARSKRKRSVHPPSGYKLERTPRFIGQLGDLQCHDTTNDEGLEDIDEGSDADAPDASIPDEYRDTADTSDAELEAIDPVELFELGSDLLDAIQDAVAALGSLTARIDALDSSASATAAGSVLGPQPEQ